MTMERTLPAEVIRELNRQESAEAYLCFMTITHPKLQTPIRVVSDPEDFVLDGDTYQGFQFELSPMNDSDQMPQCTLKVQNVDRRIGFAVLDAQDNVRMDFQIIALSEFDVSVIPRVPNALPVARVYRAKYLYLREVRCDVFNLTGTITSYDYSQEVFPGMRATQDRFPGLFW